MGTCPFEFPPKDNVPITEMDDMYETMRPAGSLAWTKFPHGGEGWVATRYKEAKAVLMDNRFSVAQAMRGDYPRVRFVEGGPPMPPSLINMDPPAHTGRRRTLSKHMTPKRINSLRPVGEALVAQRLSELQARGQGADLLATLVHGLPLLLLCELLGAPPEERDIYAGHAQDLILSRHATRDEAAAAVEVIKSYFAGLVERKRHHPGEDLISALLQDPEVQAEWTQEELDGIGTTLLSAGFESTTSFTAIILYWLIHNPAVYARLRSEPGLIPRAIDEWLRLLPLGIAGTRSRVALEDVQFGDVLVKRDQAVLAVVHAANTDPGLCRNPRSFDLDRDRPPQHVAFGFGVHFCPGAPLAKMTMDLVLRGLTSRFATLGPFEDDPDWEKHGMTRGPKSLRVRFT